MKKPLDRTLSFLKIPVGCVLFALGFNLFLAPNGLNAGGISGLATLFVHLLGFGSVGFFTLLVNLPLFALGALKLGKKFLFGSLAGMLLSAALLDLLAVAPVPETEPLIGALYGGVLCGMGLGAVFSTGASTGGSDIIVRLLKLRFQHVPIGTITVLFDLCVAALTGLVFREPSRALYCGVSIFITGQVLDTVVYRFDFSKTALIISKHHEAIAREIAAVLNRGATFLHGQGAYTHQETAVILTAVKRQQIAQLKRLVAETDPDAFIIVQEAHQVLGDGFSRYSRDAL